MAVVWPSKNNFANGDVLTAANMNNIADTLNVFNPTSATNGQVLTANGSGSASFQTLNSGGYTLISSGSLSTTTVTIGSIPSTYLHLELWLSFTTATAAYAYVEPTSFTAATEGWLQYSINSGTPQFQQMSGGSDGMIFKRDNKTKFVGIVTVLNYNSTLAKTMYVRGGMNDGAGGGGGESETAQSVLQSTTAITSLTLLSGVAFAAGSTYSLYGVK